MSKYGCSRFLVALILFGCAEGQSLGDRCTRSGECGGGQICGPDAVCIVRPGCVTIRDCPVVTPCAAAQCIDEMCQYERGSECLPGETCTLLGCDVMGDAGVDSAFDSSTDANVDAPVADVAVDAECVAPNVRCGAACVDTSSDDNNCGMCGRVCDASGLMACEAAPMCVDGECVAELRDATTVCRMPTCGSDMPEMCDGVAPECPAACGCEGEPCCEGTCAADLSCSDGTCSACMFTTPTLSGSAGMMGGMAFKGARGAGASIEFVLFDDSVVSVGLAGGASASGSYIAPSGYLTSISTSGSQLTFTDSMAGSGSVAIAGATLSGGGSSPPIIIPGGSIPGLTNRAEGSGNTLVFYSTTGVAFATITFTTVEVCP